MFTPLYVSVLDVCFIFNFKLKLVLSARVNQKNRSKALDKFFKTEFSLWEQSSVCKAEAGESKYSSGTKQLVS